ncbi:LysR family transcriptional regulator [Sodalis praecaptivus]|uniref:LysR family transcriptional regulator n=1 Tax=Sodalis praecaptivus TaxID=1239307 RepID=W0HSZ2_9GAMM|nr:LysR family transcriptional regulator [Sodalis praecaptivus]AHF75637.1 LysR family transcriptional regulator [Sodalis praecaptivus]
MKKLSPLNERDLRALRIFRVAAQARGFSAAERLLGMTKATISRQIKDIEDRLGARLCTRGPQGFELTDVGRAALRATQEALDALDRIRPEVDAARQVLSGKLALGLTDNVIGNPAVRIHLALGALCRMAPDVDLTVETLTTRELIRALLDRRLHVAIKGVYERVASLEYADLFTEQHYIYALAEGSATINGATAMAKPGRHLPLIYRAEQPFVEDALQKQGFRRGPEAFGLESVATLIATGYYSGILPAHYAALLSPRIPMQVIDDTPRYKVTFSAVFNNARPLPRSAEVLVELLAAEHATPGGPAR